VTRVETGLSKNCASIPGEDSRFFSSPKRSDLLWGPPRLYSKGTGGKAAGA
jgi:hypothetical protein